MIKPEQEDEEQLLETLALTSKLERSLRKMASSRNNTHEKTQEKTGDRSVFLGLQKEVRRLRQQNQELFRDNEEVCRDVIRLREENREIKKQLAQSQKHVVHLQGYNGDLKKQLLFWMRKPERKQGESRKEEESVGELMTEVLKLRKQNEARDYELQSLRRTVSVRDIKLPEASKKRGQQQLRIGPLSQLKKKQKEVNHTQSGHKHNKSTINECTSCNYLQSSVTKLKKKQKKTIPTSLSQKKKPTKSLCECHKHYVETSRFKP